MEIPVFFFGYYFIKAFIFIFFFTIFFKITRWVIRVGRNVEKIVEQQANSQPVVPESPTTTSQPEVVEPTVVTPPEPPKPMCKSDIINKIKGSDL